MEEAKAMRSTFLAALILILVASGLARADTVTLTNGREMHGRLVKETRDFIMLEVNAGVIRIEKTKIATYTRNRNYGRGYGVGGVPLPPKPTVEDPKPKPKPKKDEPKKDLPAWRKALPEPHESLSEEQRAELLKALEDSRPVKDEYLKAAEEGDDAARIRDLFNLMGYSRKVGNRGIREQSRKELEAFGVKNLERLAANLDSPNFYKRMNTVKLLRSLATKSDEWTWYLYHFKLHEKLINAVGEQLDLGSYVIRDEADAALRALTGQSSAFQGNGDQFRTREQARAQQEWRAYFAKAEPAFKAAQKTRAETYQKALETWKNGMDAEAPEKGS